MATCEIRPEPDKLLTVGQEISILRNAYAKSPNPEMRERYARVLKLDEHFDEVIEVLGGRGDLNFSEESLLLLSYQALETDAGALSAQDCANRMFDNAVDDEERAAALAARGKCEIRTGELTTARTTLQRALVYDPHNTDACKRLAALELGEGRAAATIALTDDLMAKGVRHARVFAAQSLALAQAGRRDEAYAASGLGALGQSTVLEPPAGWATIEAFNAALAEELVGHPAMRYERYGSASTLTWRIEAPGHPEAPLFKLLIGQIIAAIQSRMEAVADIDHPWAQAMPSKAWLRNWCVITESDGFESWHVHQFGWLSGVYYVSIPDSIARGNSRNGCLAFGLPDDIAGPVASDLLGEELVRPRSGLMLTFPSHTYHRTYPHGTGEKRICVAFDLRPL